MVSVKAALKKALGSQVAGSAAKKIRKGKARA
jgi:hypothetical protein